MASELKALWVARAGLIVYTLLVAATALNVYAVAAEIAKADGFFVDRFFLPLICGLLAGSLLAVATSGLKIAGRALVAVDIVVVSTVDKAMVREVEDNNGLVVVLRDERRVQPYVCQRTWAQQLTGNRRAATAAAVIRSWLLEPGEGEPAGTRRAPRWLVLLGVPGWALVCGAVTVAGHGVYH